MNAPTATHRMNAQTAALLTDARTAGYTPRQGGTLWHFFMGAHVVAALWPDCVLTYPSGRVVRGADAIRREMGLPPIK